MKRSAPVTLGRTVRRTVGWRPKRSGGDAVELGALISPLRYDVLVRAQFFRFLDERLDQYETDFPAFALAARQEPYFVWFERVAMARFRPWVAADQKLLRGSFDERVRASYVLWTAFRRTGFDPRYPVTLRTADPTARTEQGARVERDLYVGDGCHRLALLLANDERVLPPELYRVDRSPLRRLLDNTAVLMPALGLDEQRYAEYLSMGYADEPRHDLASLCEDVQRHRPEQLTELLDLISRDRAALAQSS